MVSLTNKLKKSTVAGLIALGFFGGLFCLSLATPGIYYYVVYAGILTSSALSIYYWRKERKADAKASPLGIWIALGVFLLFIILCLLLPAL